MGGVCSKGAAVPFDQQDHQERGRESAAAAAADVGGNTYHSEDGVKKMDDLFLACLKDGNATESLRLSCWDYGGQDTFYGLHHLYMGRNSVYVVVFNMECLSNSAPGLILIETLSSSGSARSQCTHMILKRGRRLFSSLARTKTE